MAMQKITIEPVTRIEGHAKVTIHLTEEGKEGKNAFLEKRDPDFGKFKRFP